MTLKEFIKDFDFGKPEWKNLPGEFPNCDLESLTSAEVGAFQSIVSLWKLQQPEKIEARSRVWKDPNGFQYLAVWQNAALLRVMVRVFTKGIPRNEYRLKAQMDDEARSVKRNIEEGWKRPTTSEYLDFLGFSQGSLEELRGDIRDCRTDGFLRSRPESSLLSIGIDLRVLKGAAKGLVKGEPTEPGHPYSKPLSTLSSTSLTYEIFMELANKTDWLLRKLVESLELKLHQEQKYYQVAKMRVWEKFKNIR